MTTRQIVSQLQSQGHSVSFYIRKDGGILIKSIDGVKYTGAKGNIVARSMVGATISERRQVQLERATKKHIASKGVKRPKVSDKLIKELKKVQRHWRERVDVDKTGQPTLSKLRWRLENEGRKSANRLLKEWERYTQGIAYTEVVKALKDYIEEFVNTSGNKQLEQLAKDIWSHRDSIRDEWIQPAYEVLYNLNSNIPVEDIVAEVRAILRLA